MDLKMLCTYKVQCPCRMRRGLPPRTPLCPGSLPSSSAPACCSHRAPPTPEVSDSWGQAHPLLKPESTPLEVISSEIREENPNTDSVILLLEAEIGEPGIWGGVYSQM